MDKGLGVISDIGYWILEIIWDLDIVIWNLKKQGGYL